jgi:hypothetical protein
MRPWWLKSHSVAERLPLGKAPQIGANVACASAKLHSVMDR